MATACTKPDCVRCHRGQLVLRKAADLFTQTDHWSSLTRISNGLKKSHPDYLFFMDGLIRRPLWQLDNLPINLNENIRLLEKNWKTFRTDFLRLRNDTKLHINDQNWNVFWLINQGQRAQNIPSDTMEVLDQLELFASCLFGNAFFSVLKPGGIVARHLGPTNVRLRCHLPLQIPELKPEDNCVITIDDHEIRWIHGQCLIFDDSFPHEVRYTITDPRHQYEDRCLLIVDFFHPGLTASETECLKQIFSYQND